MNIYEALNTVSWKKNVYFLWEYNLSVLRTEPLTEEQLCKKIESKSIAYMKNWEKTGEYLNLVNLYIESRIANNLEQMYKVVQEKALTGDEKSIKLLLDLHKSIQAHVLKGKSSVNNYDDL